MNDSKTENKTLVHCYMSVSYTHLDVYKRQTVSTSSLTLTRFSYAISLTVYIE